MTQATTPRPKGHLPAHNPANRCQHAVGADGRTCGGRPHIPHALYCQYHSSGGKGPAPARAEAPTPFIGLTDEAAAQFSREFGAFLREDAATERQEAAQALAVSAAREERIRVAALAKFAARRTARRRELLSATATGQAILAREDAATHQAQA